MKLQWFNNIIGEEAIRKKRKELLKEHHPDKHNTHEKNRTIAETKSKSINEEFNWLEKHNWNTTYVTEETKNKTTNTADWEEFIKRAAGSYRRPTNPFASGGFNANFVVDEDNVRWKQPRGQSKSSFADHIYETFYNRKTEKKTLENIIGNTIVIFKGLAYTIQDQEQRAKATILQIIIECIKEQIELNVHTFKQIQKAMNLKHRKEYMPISSHSLEIKDFCEVWFDFYKTMLS